MSKRQMSWLGFGVEGIIIISSILLALAIEAWWQERDDRTREQYYLNTLRSDLSAAKEELAQTIQRDSELIETAESFLAILRSDSDRITNETDWRDLTRITFDPVLLQTESLSALIVSGDIRLIEDTVMRERLVAVHALLDSKNRWRRELEADIMDVVIDLMPRIEALRTEDNIPIPADANFNLMKSLTIDTLRKEPQVAATYVNYIILLRNRANNNQVVLTTIDQLLDSLGDENFAAEH
ncbi:MAG: hypothetical protein AAF438_16860 [Pseudomonadota bacterium]